MAQLQEWLGKIEYELLAGDPAVAVDDVIYDSRKAAPGKLFVCIPGSRADGHDFIPDVYEKGVRAFVVEKKLSELRIPEDPSVTVLRVPDARKALAYLAAERFGNPFRKMISIGVTGTKGKTTVTTMIRTILEASGKKAGLIGTTGCFIDGKRTPTVNTTPESYELHEDFAKMVEAGCEYVIMECSSQGFKLQRTCGLMYDCGIFLNISPDHIGPAEHESFEEYLACKAMLLSQCRKAIVNDDALHTDEVIRISGIAPEKVIRYSVKHDADVSVGAIEYISTPDFTGTRFTAKGLYEGEILLPLPGYFNIENTLAALTASALLSLPAEKVAEGVLSTSVNGRMEVVARTDRFTIFVDYAHNEVSMVSLLDTLRKDYKPERLVVIFGCGGNRSKDRRTGMGKAAAEAADFTVITSDNPRFEKPEDILRDIHEAYLEAGGKEENCILIADRRAAIRYAMEHAEKGDMIAVIGKGHEDYVEINGVRTHFLDREVILEEKEALKL